MTFLAAPLIAAVTLKASALQITILYSLDWLPYLVFFLPIGAWVDRASRVPIMIGADLARCAITGFIPLAYFLGALALWQLYAVTFLTGAFTALYEVADQALLPSVVARSDLMRANTMLEFSRSSTRVAGPGIAGATIAAIGAPASLIADAASFIFSAAALRSIRLLKSSSEDSSAVADDSSVSSVGLLTGLSYVVKSPLLRPLAVSKAILNSGWAITEALFIVYSVRVLHIHSATLGLVFLVGNLGLVLGSTVARRVTRTVGTRSALAIGLVMQAVGMALVPLARPPFAVVALGLGLAARALGLVLFNINQVTVRQRVTPAAILGRTSAAMRMADVGVLPFGYLAGGLLSTAFPLRLTLLLPVVCVVAALVPIARMHPEELRE